MLYGPLHTLTGLNLFLSFQPTPGSAWGALALGKSYLTRCLGLNQVGSHPPPCKAPTHPFEPSLGPLKVSKGQTEWERNGLKQLESTLLASRPNCGMSEQLQHRSAFGAMCKPHVGPRVTGSFIVCVLSMCDRHVHTHCVPSMCNMCSHICHSHVIGLVIWPCPIHVCASMRNVPHGTTSMHNHSHL